MVEGARVDRYDGTRHWNELPAVIRHLSTRQAVARWRPGC